MFQGGMFTISGNIPDDLYQKINRVSYAFYKALTKTVEKNNYNRSVMRLLKPVNTVVLLENSFIHFVFTNKSVGGALRIVHNDFRGKTNIDLNTAIEIVKRDLGFEEPFGFSITSGILNSKQEDYDEIILPYVNEYINNEANHLEKLSKQVRINPLFQGRDFYINDKLCFVLMPFHEKKVQEIYEDHIKPTVEKIGLTCKRADDMYGPNPIIEDIWKSINESKFLIADVTGRNPNVFYEIGVAHTIGKNVIIISQDINDIPFDLRHLRCIIYDNTPRGAKTLSEQIELSAKTLLK
jgi:hypothetical protein